MAAIPSWVMMLLKLFISIGSPYLLAWLKDKIKGLPTEVVDIINELIKSLVDPAVNNREAKKVASAKLKACVGVACPSETKSS